MLLSDCVKQVRDLLSELSLRLLYCGVSPEILAGWCVCVCVAPRSVDIKFLLKAIKGVRREREREWEWEWQKQQNEGDRSS